MSVELGSENGVAVYADLREMIDLFSRKEELNGELKKVNEKLRSLNERTAEHFVLNDVQNTSIVDDGGQAWTFYKKVNRFVSLKKECKAEAKAAAESLGLEDMISLNASSFAAYIKEQMGETGDVPTEFSGMVNVYEEIAVGHRRG